MCVATSSFGLGYIVELGYCVEYQSTRQALLFYKKYYIAWFAKKK